jgi:5-methylcytosine-specific restriction endonuclease McrA
MAKQYRDWCSRQRNPDGSYGLPCSITGCNQPINYHLAYPHPHSFELDHILPTSARPDLAYDPNNFQPSHLRCNRRKSNKLESDDDLDIGEPSEVW